MECSLEGVEGEGLAGGTVVELGISSVQSTERDRL